MRSQGWATISRHFRDPDRQYWPIGLGILEFLRRRDIRPHDVISLINVPDDARLTTGTNNGDKSWSINFDGVADTVFVRPTDRGHDCRLTLRVSRIDPDLLSCNVICRIDLTLQDLVRAHQRAETSLKEEFGDAPGLERRLAEFEAKFRAEHRQLMADIERRWQQRLEAVLARTGPRFETADEMRSPAEPAGRNGAPCSRS